MNRLLKKSLGCLIIALSLSACEKLPVEYFNDTIWDNQDTQDYGVAWGEKAFYIYWGELHQDGENILAGQAIAPDHKFIYPIADLLKQNPECRNPHSLKAAAAQKEMWTEHPPQFVRIPNK